MNKKGYLHNNKRNKNATISPSSTELIWFGSVHRLMTFYYGIMPNLVTLGQMV